MDISKDILEHNWKNITSYAFNLNASAAQNSHIGTFSYISSLNNTRNTNIALQTNVITYSTTLNNPLKLNSSGSLLYIAVQKNLNYCVVNNPSQSGCNCLSVPIPQNTDRGEVFLFNSFPMSGCVYCCLKTRTHVYHMHSGGSGVQGVPIWQRFADLYNMINLAVLNNNVQQTSTITLETLVKFLKANIRVIDAAFIHFGDNVFYPDINCEVKNNVTLRNYYYGRENYGLTVSILQSSYLGVGMMSQLPNPSNRGMADSFKVRKLTW